MKKDKVDIIIFFISKVIIGFLSLISMTIYSKILTTSEYGNYSLISGLCNALVSIFIGWIGSSALRYYIDYEKEDKEKFFTNIFFYTSLMVLIIILIEIIVGLFSDKIPIRIYLLQTVYLTLGVSFSEVFEKIFRASEKTLKYAISIVLQSIFTVVFVVISLNYFSDGTNAMLLSLSSAKTIFIILALICIGFSFRINKNSFDKKMFKKFLNYGIPMIGVWGVSWLLNYCDRYIIVQYYSSSEVGIYDMSCKLAENSLNLIITSFTLAVYPILIRRWKEYGKKYVENMIKNIINYYLLLIVPATIGLIGISEKLYNGILDPKYLSGRLTIIIICIGLSINGFTAIINKIWQLNEKTKKILYIMIVSVIVNILLNFIFIPKYGITMAAITTLFSYFLSFIVTIILVRKEFTLKIDYISIMKTFVASIIMGLFIALFNNYVNNNLMLLVEIIMAMIIYLIITILLKNIDIKRIKKGEII